MTHWIILTALAACSTPKGLEAFDSGEEPSPNEDAAESDGSAGGDETGGEEGTGSTTGDETGEVGDPCEAGTGIIDCEYTCWADSSSMIGDGICDDGTRGPNFYCSHFEYDRGDCFEGSDEGGSTGGTTSGTTDGGTSTGGTTSGGGSEGSGSTGAATSDATGGSESGTGSTDGSGSGGDSTTTGGSSDDGDSTTGGSGSGGSSTGGSSTGGSSSSWETCGDEDAPGTTFAVTGTTDGEPHSTTASCSFLVIGHPTYDYSYSWVPDSEGTYCITTDESTFDTVLSVWNATCSEELACDDDGGTTPIDGSFVRTSAIEFVATAGERYIILVDGNHRDSDFGSFTLDVASGPCL